MQIQVKWPLKSTEHYTEVHGHCPSPGKYLKAHSGGVALIPGV